MGPPYLVSFLKPVAVSAASGSLATTVLGGCRLARRITALYSLTESARCPFQAEPTHYKLYCTRSSNAKVSCEDSSEGSPIAGLVHFSYRPRRKSPPLRP